jgi:hypothetical protein
MFDTSIRDVAEATTRGIATRLQIDMAEFLPADELMPLIQQRDQQIYDLMWAYFKALVNLKLYEAARTPDVNVNPRSQIAKEGLDLLQQRNAARAAFLGRLNEVAPR